MPRTSCPSTNARRTLRECAHSGEKFAVHINILYPHGQSTAHQIFGWQLRRRSSQLSLIMPPGTQRSAGSTAGSTAGGLAARAMVFSKPPPLDPPRTCKRQMQVYCAAQVGKHRQLTTRTRNHMRVGGDFLWQPSSAASSRCGRSLFVSVGDRCAWRKTSPRRWLFHNVPSIQRHKPVATTAQIRTSVIFFFFW